jgi:hypothetical protein
MRIFPQLRKNTLWILLSLGDYMLFLTEIGVNMRYIYNKTNDIQD